MGSDPLPLKWIEGPAYVHVHLYPKHILILTYTTYEVRIPIFTY